MPLSDAQLVNKLEDLAFQFETKDDYVTTKLLMESAARILQLSGLGNSWHPARSTTWSNEMESVVEFLVKNPWKDEM